MSDYINPADCADVIRHVTPDEKWLTAQIARIDPHHDEQGHDAGYTRALEKLALQQRDELAKLKKNSTT
ncbi:hypothetical protein [Rhodoferax ferrireducens]|uniref:hypothetical protein n=1 Tax=Rhodoferax ferrireducens TaxID=192843 RepID=UPI000E0D08C5|nr:hypothetical protein [Rhodoferax ferrireducens]